MPTRYYPSPGEPFTGHIIRLSGTARVQHPECMSVQTRAAKEYYGFVWLNQRPLEESIELTINGRTIPQSTTNGWELLKDSGSPEYHSNFKIQIKSPTDRTQVGKTYSGYFLELHGNAVYSNGAVVKATFLPSAR